MATVNKDFKIKSGLIVEGTTATVNGYDILTKKPADDQYIIDLIGGETLVKSVEATQLEVDGAGKLSVKSGVFDADGAADTAQQNAEDYTDNALESYTLTEDLDATVDGYGYLKSEDISGKQDTLTAGSNIDISGTTISVTGLDTDDVSEGTNLYFTNQRALDATSSAYDAAGTATGLIQDGQTDSTHLWSSYKTSTEIGLAQAAAEQHADEAVAALIDSAPAMLDTLNELAASLGDNADFIGTVNAAIGEKVAKAGDTMTGELVLAADPTQAYAAATKNYVDTTATDTYNDAIATAADDATSKANAAEQNAKDYADDLTTSDIAEGTNLYFTNQRAIDAVGGTIGDAINDLTTDDIEEGLTNQYFTDARAKSSAADLLTGASLTNITITGTGAGLTITAENGVADSNTDQLSEGSTNLYFTDSRAVNAIDNANITPNQIDINWARTETATWTAIPTASQAVCHQAGGNYGTIKYLVRVVATIAGTRHSHATEVLATVDGSNGVAVVEYGTIYTSAEPMATVTVLWNGATNCYELNVTTANNNSEVMVAASALATID